MHETEAKNNIIYPVHW